MCVWFVIYFLLGKAKKTLRILLKYFKLKLRKATVFCGSINWNDTSIGHEGEILGNFMHIKQQF